MKPLLLLHGAIGSQDQLFPLQEALSDTCHTYTLNFSGHGGSPFIHPFSIHHFAQEVLEWLQENKISSIHIFGYSMGGYVAMYLALHHPEVVDSVATLGTKFYWDEPTAAKEVKKLQPDKIESKVPQFASQLQERHHPDHWKQVLQNTAEMMQEMGRENPIKIFEYRQLKCPALVMMGDKDNLVTIVESVTVYHELPKGQLAILPATPHPFEQVNLPMVAMMLKRFYCEW